MLFPIKKPKSKHSLVPIGTKFGQWKVVENDHCKIYGKYVHSACRVRCSCESGITKIISSQLLRNGRSKSCGCIKKGKKKTAYIRIPIGTKFGRWEIIENGLYSGKRMLRSCRVRCQCGSEAIRSNAELRAGYTKSCGCMSKGPTIEAAWNHMFDHIKRRGWEFHLTLPQLKLVTKMPCVYCGKEPANIYRYRNSSLEIVYSGLDRVDSSKGYVHGNVVPCCSVCNGMKSKLPLHEFLGLVERIQRNNPTVDKIHSLAATLFEA